MNFLQKYNLTKHLNRFVDRKKREKVQVCSLEKALCICVFYTFESVELLEQIVQSVRLLKNNKNNIIIYCYIPEKENVLMENQEDSSKNAIFHTRVMADLIRNLLKTIHLTRGLQVTSAVTKEVFKSPKEGVYFISEKDFDFKGSLSKEKLLALQKTSFDMLIDLDMQKKSLFSLYLTGKIKAKFRIGRCEQMKEYYHVTLYSNENYTLDDYFQSIDKYTKKIVQS